MKKSKESITSRFKVGEEVRHFSGSIGTITDIKNRIVYISYAGGLTSQCDTEGYPSSGLYGEKVVFKLTKLERALK